MNQYERMQSSSEAKLLTTGQAGIALTKTSWYNKNTKTVGGKGKSFTKEAMCYTEQEVEPLWLHVSVLVTWLIHCFVLLFVFLCYLFCISVFGFVFAFWVLCFWFEFCVSVLGFVFLFWVLCFCFGFCDSVLSFVIMFWVLWFCFEFCDSVLSFNCDSVLGFVILF